MFLTSVKNFISDEAQTIALSETLSLSSQTKARLINVLYNYFFNIFQLSDRDKS